MKKKRCAACGKFFPVRTQIPSQSYCPIPECQKERRRRWQRNKLKTDSDYRENQGRAQRAWMDRNPDYWREYREMHPNYVQRNREKQRSRALRNRALAKMNVSAQPPELLPGIYRIKPVVVDGLAKNDVWTVEISLLFLDYPSK
jgi:hypothetical protein